MLGMSKKVNLDNVKICLENEVVTISCKDFATKYENYLEQINANIDKTLYNT